jgi:hypothetical protein
MYTETFITDITIEELYDEMEAEALYFNDEWLDDEPDDSDLEALSEMFGEWEPDEEFWAYLDEMDEEPDFDEVGFDPYEGCYTFDC